ncbi:hypothetical protein DSO57_1006707 [Entomophthora muscae]|uniref:Uncharacterized protein n=1 Tax=Entomophthora muscae TaxID=34485 RepID=A0ACC2UHH3_9FUNG|nr:hypothetical protein DSO57_1006707 [Entomophthora muscae]
MALPTGQRRYKEGQGIPSGFAVFNNVPVPTKQYNFLSTYRILNPPPIPETTKIPSTMGYLCRLWASKIALHVMGIASHFVSEWLEQHPDGNENWDMFNTPFLERFAVKDFDGVIMTELRTFKATGTIEECIAACCKRGGLNQLSLAPILGKNPPGHHLVQDWYGRSKWGPKRGHSR